ncbi:MAG: hypothetical protein ACQEXX_02280 [Bacillota bacterium]
MSVLEAITNPAIALSGFVGTAIFGFISAQAKIKKNPLRFLVSLEESQFMSGSMRLFRFFYLGLLVLCFSTFYSIFIASLLLTETNFMKLFKFTPLNLITLFVVAILIFCIMQLLCMVSVQKKITDIMYQKNRKRKTRQAFILVALIFIFIYLVFYSLIYGCFITLLLIEQARLLNILNENLLDILLSIHLFEKSAIIMLAFITFIYALLIYRVKNLFMYLGHSKIAINIVMKNGIIFENKQLLHSDIENSYLISDSSNIFDPTKHLIPKNNIEYLSFKNTYCSLGKDVPQIEEKIITLDSYTVDELALFRSIIKKEENQKKML